MAIPTSLTTSDSTVACLALTTHVILVPFDSLEPPSQVAEAVEPDESVWSLELYHHPTDDWTSIAPGVQVRKNGDGIVVRVLKNS